MDKGRSSYFRDEFFFGVRFRAEEGGSGDSVQPLGVSRAVDQFVEDRGVVFGGFLELGQQRKRDGIVRGTIEGSVALFVVQLYAGSLQVVAYDGFGLLVGVCGLRAFRPSHWSMWKTL